MLRSQFGHGILLNPDPGAGGGGAAAGAPAGGGEGTITIAERNQAIEKARGEEKAKLYPQIQALTEEKEALKAKVAQHAENVTKLTEQLASLKGKFEALEKAKGANGEIDIKALITEVTTRVQQETEAKYKPELDAVRGDIGAMRAENRKLTLEQYKAKRIGEVGAENLIVQLVTGTNEAEIDAAIESSKTIFESTKSRITGGQAPIQNPPGQGQGRTAPPVVPTATGAQPAGGGGAPGTNGQGVPEVRNMSRQEWAAKRGQLKEEFAQRYGPK
jgi:hypothetical protein